MKKWHRFSGIVAAAFLLNLSVTGILLNHPSLIERFFSQKNRNLDGFLIGQASFGNPWIFDATATNRTFKEKIPLIMNHAAWLMEHKGLTVGCREIRKHLVQYVKGIPGARAFRSQLVRVTSLSDIHHILTDIDTHTLG